MDLQKLQKLPIGIQSFEELRSENYLYVDKTEHIYNLATGGKTYFLSRPRRFGKSMLCSTFKALFEGKKNLFEDTWIASSNWKWATHPVIHLDMSELAYTSSEGLKKALQSKLLAIGNQLGVTLDAQQEPSDTLHALITTLANKGPQAILLIDEYDKPIVNSLTNLTLLAAYREILYNFYGPLKALGSQLRFLFITGVSQFAKLSIFSALNHLDNLSISPNCSTLCGYTQAELERQFIGHIEKTSKELSCSTEELLLQLKIWYNGYLFTLPQRSSERVYNPFSVINFFNQGIFKNYWFESGTPTFVIDYFKQHTFSMADFEQVKATEGQLSAIIPEQLKLTTVLYQTGYLTIKSYADRQFVLGFPNQEVAEACSLALAQFVNPALPDPLLTCAMQLSKLFEASRVTEIDLTTILKVLCAQIPSTIAPGDEKDYQFMFWLVLKLSGLNVNVEEPTALGRIDAVVTINNHVYVIELKIRGTADQALEQIRTKRYAEKYATTEKPVICIGIVFDVQQRTITECKITK